MVELIEIVDWFIDAFALYTGLFVAVYLTSDKDSYSELVKETLLVFIIVCLTYGIHEAWEGGYIFDGTHRELEWWIAGR